MHSKPRYIDEIFSEATSLLVKNNWDLPSPGQQLDSLSRYHGPDQSVREKIKAAGRELQKNSSLRDQLLGYVLESYGHFFGSEEAAYDQSRPHPKFREYFQHWVHSDTKYFNDAVRELFLQWIEKPSKLKIQSGKTFWR